MIIDAHAHYGAALGLSCSDEEYIESMDRWGIDRAVFSSMLAISGNEPEGNDAVHRMIRRWPDRVVGYCVPNPYRRPAEELARCIDMGFRAVKLHPRGMGCPMDNRMYRPVYEEAQRRRMPVLFHSGGLLTMPDFRFTSPDMILRIARAYPELPLLAGHMGLERWLDLVNVAPDVENVYLDITMSLPDLYRLEKAVQTVGAERVLFGTDLPLLDPSVPLGLVQGADLTDEQRRLILGGNMVRLLEAVR